MKKSKKFQLLESENTALKKRVKEQSEKIDHLEKTIEYLLLEIKKLKRHRFGTKSERYEEGENPQQSLFSDEELPEYDLSDSDDSQKDQNASDENPPNPKKNRKAINSDHLPTREEIVPVPGSDKQCHCGKLKKLIRHEISFRINHIPERFEKIEEKREVYACANGCEHSIIVAESLKRLLPKCEATEEVLAQIAMNKYVDRQPFYHIEKQWQQKYNVFLPRNTMARWMIQLSNKLQVMVNLLEDQILSYDVGSLDITKLQVLREDGRKATTDSSMYCFIGYEPGKECVVYDYNAIEHKQYLFEKLGTYKGYLHADADPWFEGLAKIPEITFSFCNAHARRKFEEIVKVTKNEGLASYAMSVFKALYKIEREAKDAKLNADKRKELRQKKSKPLLEHFKKWLDINYPKTLPKSPVGQAMHYTLKYWTELTRFLEDGRLEIDNNLTEQKIKPFVIARKNFLFSCSVAGAYALGNHFSLIQTAIMHGLNPYDYYVLLLKRLPYCKTIEEYEALLPWNIKSEMAQMKKAA
jgi:transposase